MLSALAHHADRGVDVAWLAIQSLFDPPRLDPARVALYHDLVVLSLDEATRQALEALMSSSGYQYPQSDFARKHFGRGRAEGRAEGKAEGRAEAKAEDVLSVLRTRGIALSDADEARIASCRDLEQLEVWLRRAITATAIDEVFD